MSQHPWMMKVLTRSTRNTLAAVSVDQMRFALISSTFNLKHVYKAGGGGGVLPARSKAGVSS